MKLQMTHHLVVYAHGLHFLKLQWRPNGHYGVSDQQSHYVLLNRLIRHRSKKTSKLHVSGLCAGNSPVTGEFLAQRASNVENVSIWRRHDDTKPAGGNFVYRSVNDRRRYIVTSSRFFLIG